MIGHKHITKISHTHIVQIVHKALDEDIRTGDLTALLIDSNKCDTAHIITREHACICGIEYVREVFTQVDPSINLEFIVKDGDIVGPNDILFIATGNSRGLLTAERTALNFLQTMSGTATVVHNAVKHLQGHTKLLDTRKTIPNLRIEQKYAVCCGGGHNHRFGLFAAFLIKENHIAAAGSIELAIARAKHIKQTQNMDTSNHIDIEVEVENLVQLEKALQSNPDIIMLDNFDYVDVKTAIAMRNRHINSHIKIEVSGNISISNLAQISALGVDYISSGAITKHVHAIDLSMRIQ
jgi:nicotinate-nucleotide pyrophosphorylase (carboxylating)